MLGSKEELSTQRRMTPEPQQMPDGTPDQRAAPQWVEKWSERTENKDNPTAERLQPIGACPETSL